MYLITGGAGFIGSNLADALVRDGERVRIFDDFSSGSLDNLAAIRDRVEIVEGDLRDYDAVKRAMQRRELRRAPGGAALGRALGGRPAEQRRGQRARHAARAAWRRANAGRARVVLRVVVVGVRRESEALPKVEDQTPAPISPYAVSKLAAEQYCRVFSKLYGVETVSLRYFNVFGPKQSPESKYAAVVPLFMRAACDARAARDPRRRRAVARLHLHRQRRAGESAGDAPRRASAARCSTSRAASATRCSTSPP